MRTRAAREPRADGPGRCGLKVDVRVAHLVKVLRGVTSAVLVRERRPSASRFFRLFLLVLVHSVSGESVVRRTNFNPTNSCRARAREFGFGSFASFSSRARPVRLSSETHRESRCGGPAAPGPNPAVALLFKRLGDPTESTTLAEADLRRVIRRAQLRAERGMQLPGFFRDRAAQQTELATQIGEALRARDVV